MAHSASWLPPPRNPYWPDDPAPSWDSGPLELLRTTGRVMPAVSPAARQALFGAVCSFASFVSTTPRHLVACQEQRGPRWGPRAGSGPLQGPSVLGEALSPWPTVLLGVADEGSGQASPTSSISPNEGLHVPSVPTERKLNCSPGCAERRTGTSSECCIVGLSRPAPWLAAPVHVSSALL